MEVAAALVGHQEIPVVRDVLDHAAAAASQGYTITMEELERCTADMEELDSEEMDAVGGFGKKPTPRSEWIPTEKGHDIVCLGVWHCYTAFLHTETSDKRVPCWKDYT